MHLELVRERFQLEQLGRLRMLVQEANGRPENIEIELDLLQDAGPAHLDDDFAAVLQQRRMDLGDRSAREWLRVDASEGVRSELFVDRLPNLLECHGRCGVDELREFFDVDVREEVGA